MKRYLIALIILLHGIGCMAQASTVLVSDIHKVYQKLKPEFIYLHTDRTIYLNGETIWFKTYLLNTPFQREDLSVIVYVELIDSDNELFLRKKIKSTDGLSFGNIEIPESVQTGKYTIRAYTQWMRNIGSQCFYEQDLFFYNFKNDGLEFSPPKTESKSTIHESDSSLLRIFKNNDGLSIKLKTKIGVTVVAQYRGEIVLQRDLTNVDEEFIIKDLPFGLIEFGIYNDKYELIDNFSIRNTVNPKYRLIAELNKKIFSTREKVELTVLLKDQKGKSVKGNLSVSVVPKNFYIDQPNHLFFDGTLDFKDINHLRPFQILYSKEQLIFPKQSQSLKPVEFKTHQDYTNRRDVVECMTDTSLAYNLFSRYSMTSEILKSYGHSESGNQFSQYNYNLSYDDVYYPDEYSQMPTLEDFIREVINNVKIKDTGTSKALRLLNTEDKRKVFLYKKDPLVLINGIFASNVNEILSMDISTIDEIGLIWKINSLAKSSIAKIADGGILAMQTKSGVKISMADGEEKINIYEGFSSPRLFLAKNYSNQPLNGDKIPDFRNPLHWIPDTKIDEKRDFTFYTSDEISEFVIDVSGVTEDGAVVHRLVEFSVK